MYYYYRLKRLAKNLNILDSYEENFLNIKINLQDGKYGTIYVQFDFKENDYSIRLNVNEDQFCHIYNLGYDEISAYRDEISRLNFMKKYDKIDLVVKELDRIINMININCKYRLTDVDFKFAEKAKEIIKVKRS